MPIPVYCTLCGVELETGMHHCPLCGNPVNSADPANEQKRRTAFADAPLFSPYDGPGMPQPQKKITWEVLASLLVCTIIATSSINLIINKEISWSEYPIAICLIVFAYVTVFVFWTQRTVLQLLVSFLAASVALFFLDLLTGGIKWVFTLAIPLLLTTNLTTAGLLTVIRLSRQKGINLIAYGFLAATLLCIGIETILSFYLHHHLRLWWSVIVSACVLPVMVVLLLMHYRYKRGRDLQKTFHL